MKKGIDNLKKFYQAHPRAEKVMKGFSYLFSEKILKFAVGFFVHALVARYLGPTQFGKLSFITKTVSVFYTFSLFGVDEIIIKYLLDGRYSRSDVLKTVFYIRMCMAFFGFFCLGVFLLFSHPESTAFSLLVFAYGVQIFIQVFNLFELDFQAQLNFRPLFWANNISNIFASLLRILGIVVKLGIPYFIGTYLLGDVLLKIIVQIKHGFSAFKGKFHDGIAKDLIQSSWPHFLAAFVLIFDQRISYIFIEKLLPSPELGNYSVAVTLVDMWIFLPTAVCVALFPTIVSVFKQNEEAYMERIQYLSDIMTWMSLFFVLGVYLTSEYVINILYGSKYAQAPGILAWYSLVTLPIFFNLARLKWMSLENNLKDWLILCVLTFGVNVALHYYLVPVFGVRGAIWSYLGSQLIVNTLGCFWSPSFRRSAKVFLKTLSFPLRMIQKAF